jgi:hypothetical protein
MKARKYYLVVLVVLVILALAMVLPARKASAHGDESQFIAESSLLIGLAPGAVFPFIDTTPHGIAQAHIAITDATTNCSAGAAAPSNLQVLDRYRGPNENSVLVRG